MNLDIFLSLFSLMLISLGVSALSEKTHIPFTVLLVIAGSVLVPLSGLEQLAFIDSFKMTPELLFFVFLPILIFESAYNINIRNMANNIIAISALAVISLLISVAVVGVGLHFALAAIGLNVPMTILFLFGAIISATDPVAVLSLFKEYGAPRRLTLIFEGESLFNDGTAFAIFMVLLEISLSGFKGAESVLEGIATFCTMVVGGLGFGLAMGFLFARLIKWSRGNEHVEITLTVLVAHFTFILTELLSENLELFGFPIHLSAIIATLAASMVIGNYGRYKMSPKVEQYMEKFWGYFAFLANSLVFILMGLTFAQLSIGLHVAIWPILLAIGVVAIGRAVSIYPVVGMLNLIKQEERIPASWQHLLSWGSLRGALAVIMALLIPDNLTVSGWSYDFSVKEFIIALTIGCIYFTLLIKATTIGWVMRKLKIDALTSIEKVEYHESKAFIINKALEKLRELETQGYVSPEEFVRLRDFYESHSLKALVGYREEVGNSMNLAEANLRLYALGLEKAGLRELLEDGKVDEKIYKKVLNMLHIQVDRLEHGTAQVASLDEKFPIDSVEKFINLTRKLVFLPKRQIKSGTLLSYYRIQRLLVNRVLDHFQSVELQSLIKIFGDEVAIEKVRQFFENVAQSIDAHIEMVEHTQGISLIEVNHAFVASTLRSLQADVLEYLYRNEIITNKLYILLNNELAESDYPEKR